jgi:hypothetical protein
VPIVLQNSFWSLKIFSEPWVWRSNNYVGTTPPCVKLTGDSGNGDCRLFRLFRGKLFAQRFGTVATLSAKSRRLVIGCTGKAARKLCPISLLYNVGSSYSEEPRVEIL